jgi:histidine triad (HIT) family protein
LLVQGIENEHVTSRQDDIFYKDKYVTAFIASHWWPNNRGHIIIIPNKHIESLYDLPDNLSAKIYALSKQVALAFKKVYKCDGVSLRQHNEHDGGQDVWHYHLHVFPRYKNDDLYLLTKQIRKTTPKERKPYAIKLRKYFGSNY